MRLLKLPLKLLALPLTLILCTLHIINKLASNFSAYVIGLVMLVVLVCGIQQAYIREWLNVAILFGVETVCAALQFSAMFLVELAGVWAEGLGVFLHCKSVKNALHNNLVTRKPKKIKVSMTIGV